MAYASAAAAPTTLEFTKAPAQAPAQVPSHAPALAKPNLFSRFVTALQASRMRQAERDVARYLSAHGGKFTDEAERNIERRFLSNSSRW